MREIKFRGRRKDGKWLYGDLIHNRGGVYIADDSVVDGTDIQGHTDFKVDPSTVGQFTGFRDPNDKEIYEGDIIREHEFRDKYTNRKVYWDNEYAGWYLRSDSGKFPLYYIYYDSDDIVIGNIHDNPELMKGGEI